ncbi:MAG: PKD domain-containing protein [Bacteroidota bacterium]
MEIKKKILILAFVLLTAITGRSQTFVRAEYFFDTDPGIGNGTPINLSLPGDNIVFTSSISTASLLPGFHHLAIRMKQSGGPWGIFESRGFYISTAASAASNITAAEYFFDNDPGLGNGTSIPVTAGANVNFTVVLPTGALSTGFHFLTLRTKGSDGKWSVFESRGFYISTVAAVAPNIVAAEYFFDADPGLGNATAIAVTPGSTVNFTVSLPTTSLSPGFHFLAIRTKGADGKWGVFESRGFYLSEVATPAPDIVAAEYFFDADPGQGNGTSITIPSGATSNFTVSLPPTSLSTGFHFLTIRTKNVNGHWGIFESRGFYVSNQTDDMGDIVAAEFFFDTDPGEGNGQGLAITTPGAIVNQVFALPVPANFPAGVHTVGIRVQTANGQWSIKENGSFTVFNNQVPTVNAGSDQTISFPTNSITLSGTASDPDGSIASFSWTKISGPATGTIADPTQASTSVTNLSGGIYRFELTVTDNSGAFGRDTVQITVNTGPNQPPVANAGADQNITLPNDAVLDGSASLDPDGTIASFAWSKISGPTSGTIVNANLANTAVTNLEVGVYQIQLTVTDNSGATAQDVIQVTVNAGTNQPPVANAGPDQNIALPASSVVLNGSASTDDGSIVSFSWSKISGPASHTIVNAGQPITAVNNLTLGVYRFELIVVDNNGLSDRDTVQVSVSTCPPPPVITLSGGVLICNPAGPSHQWYRDGQPIEGATGQALDINIFEYGVFAVEVIGDGCTSRSADFVYLVTAAGTQTDDVVIYPNPFTEKIVMVAPIKFAGVKITIIDALGRSVIHSNLMKGYNEISTNSLAQGIYYIFFDGALGYKVQKL